MPIVTIGCNWGSHEKCKSLICECSCHAPTTTPVITEVQVFLQDYLDNAKDRAVAEVEIVDAVNAVLDRHYL